MTQFVCLVHYHELGLKGRNRSSFEQQLRNNIKQALQPAHASCRVSRISGRQLVEAASYAEALAVAAIVALIPGVARVSCGLRTTQKLEDIYEAALQAMQLAEPFHSFKVDSRRANTNFATPSMELSRLAGAWL
jgi:thiamine biosynthesis protein ThiI